MFKIVRITVFCAVVFITQISIKPIVAQSVFHLSDFYKKIPQIDSLIEKHFIALSDTQRVGQMIMPAAGGLGKSNAEIEKLTEAGLIGGVLFLKTNVDDVKKMTNLFSGKAVTGKTIPLLFSTDGEPSLINGKIKGLPQFAKTNQLKNPEESANAGKAIASILKELSILYNFAPVCDLASNKEVISNRSYGSDKQSVIDHCKAFIRASQNEGVAATIKHFPGHGFVKGDSHLNLVCIDGEMKETDVYTPLIADSVVSVMVGHIAVKNNDKYNTAGLPSSCSEIIVKKLLREEMNFKGIIVTDGMNMGALNNIPNATFKAVEAGCDIILIPGNERKLHSQILTKMKESELFKTQIYESVKRIIRLKICLGLIK